MNKKPKAESFNINELQPVPHQAELELMNSKFHVMQIGGKARILMFIKTPTGTDDALREMVTFMAFPDFKALQDVKKITVTTKNKSGEEVDVKRGIGSWWLDQEQRDQYSGLVFLPGQDKVIGTDDNRHFNLWRGFGIVPKPGQWPLLRRHIELVLANGNKVHAEYILN
jgi:hypothetical protein